MYIFYSFGCLLPYGCTDRKCNDPTQRQIEAIECGGVLTRGMVPTVVGGYCTVCLSLNILGAEQCLGTYHSVTTNKCT